MYMPPLKKPWSCTFTNRPHVLTLSLPTLYLQPSTSDFHVVALSVHIGVTDDPQGVLFYHLAADLS